MVLTSDKSSYQTDGISGRLAGRPQRFQYILREGERRDGVARRHQDEQRHPQVQERGQRAERLTDVRVVAARLRDHCACGWRTIEKNTI